MEATLSSSPIELTILSVKPQDSHVHHAASHVYVKKKITLSFNLVKVQDCCIFKFIEMLGYILSYHPIPALTGFYFIGRIQFWLGLLFFFFYCYEGVQTDF